MATLGDLTSGVVQLLGNRGDVAALATQALADSIIEITNNYPFEELRETGPLVQFTPGVNQYLPSTFVQPAGGGNPQHVWNKLVSWFFYLQPPVNLSTIGSIGYANPGYNIRFRDIEDLEVLANTLSLPQFWSQLGNGFLYVAATPNLAYFTYQRYQYLHPFTFPATPFNVVLITELWWDIFQYAAAERVALKLRMQDVADRMHSKLYGDPEFQRSSGGRGEPGLIARRISQTQKNQSRSTRSVRMIGRQGY